MEITFGNLVGVIVVGVFIAGIIKDTVVLILTNLIKGMHKKGVEDAEEALNILKD